MELKKNTNEKNLRTTNKTLGKYNHLLRRICEFLHTRTFFKARKALLLLALRDICSKKTVALIKLIQNTQK